MFHLSSADIHHIWEEDGHFYSLEISDSHHEDAAIYTVTATNPYGCVSCRCRLVVDSGLRSVHRCSPIVAGGLVVNK